MKRKLLKRLRGKKAAFYLWLDYYRNRVRIIESELGSKLEAC